MRTVIRAACLALAAALVIAYLARHAPAQEIHFPSNLSIEGQVVCAGPPVTGDALIFRNGQWCNGIANGVPFNAFLANGNRTQVLFIGTDNRLLLGDGTNDVGLNPFSALDLSTTGGIKWQDNSGGAGFDTQETFQQRSTVTWYRSSALTTGGWGQYTPTKAMHVRSIDVDIAAGPAGCTTNAVLKLSVGGVQDATSTITLANGTTDYHVGGLNIAVGAGVIIGAANPTAAAGCTTAPSQVNYLAEFTTD